MAQALLQDVGGLIFAIIALGILVIVHEGGHFLIARLSGMRVDRFSVGFGPKLYSFQRGETSYQIAAIPLGGFVQIAGLNPGEEGISADDPRAYPNRPVLLRLATVFAGPATNYVFAALVMILSFLIWGVQVPGDSEPMVGGVADGKPAAAAGLQPGDLIVSIGGQKMQHVNDVAPAIRASKGEPVTVDVLRDGKPMAFSVRADKDADYRIGIEVLPKEDKRAPAPFFECVKQGAMYPIHFSAFILHSFAEIFRGRQKAEFGGPIAIVKVMKRQIQNGLRSAFDIIAIISIYLGLFNLLPLPALDGGRMVFLGWELISRRRVNQRLEQMVHLVGMFALLGFIVYVTLRNDLGLGARISKLFQ